MSSENPTPILKRNLQPTKRHSVTFSQLPDTSPPSEDPVPQPSSSNSDLVTGIRLTDYGLHYEPPAPSLPNLSKLHPGINLVSMRECERAELGSEEADDHILMLGDATLGQHLKKELEALPHNNIRVTQSTQPTEELVQTCSFFLVLLPLDQVNSCDQVKGTLNQLGTLRSDYLLRSAVVAITSAHGSDQFVADLFNLHTLLLQQKIAYYVWSNVVPAGWPSIIDRLAVEIRSCRHEFESRSKNGGESRDRVASRALLSSLLWHRDPGNSFLNEYLDVTVLRSRQHLEF
ncbi:uncharacterized protein LOC108667761 [Hyalella azteca]|uniref:Uncharacterized protein LOC108667761 n=1 Tax=Hyalella azteca TaxID=294128 RepID=A0A8B7N9D5_HYAAZ|nr:uncharacterized protein LOC108667761 [Hyalella azteca]